MYPFQNILFSTDFSNNSKSALKYAAAFARQHNATLFIHNSQEASLPPNALKLSERALSDGNHQWLITIKKELENLAHSHLLTGLKVELILTEGNPKEEIPRVIRDHGIDLATIGTTARPGLGGALGSTALSVMGQASCPLLFTRQPLHDFVYYKKSETNIALNRILFATSLSDTDDSAKRLAFALAHAHQAELTILHSIGSFLGYIQAVSLTKIIDVEDRVRSDASERLSQLAKEAGDVVAETLLTEGSCADEVLRVATEKDVDLIVIGTGKPNGTNTLPGREAERIVRHACCPVLTIRHGTIA
ncbi:MAG: universal stress protein [Blastocatellia bacterium]|nr:universal stress protein [Blastocatellia bacterium]MBN8721881.1 universal stress protein [Acidobacteriota bacterium]